MDNDNPADDDKTAPSSVPSGSLAPGTVVGTRFRVEVLVGRGGMGSVYRASDTSTGQPVALKLLHAVTSPEVMYRFNREASLLSMLRHPGIVSYVAHGTGVGNQPYLAMEWLEGEDLSRHLARQPLSLSESLSLVRRVAEALAVAHQQGIVHRDIKPANLLLRGGRPGDVVVLDFGLARHAVPTLLGVTGSYTVVGTPGYMAPEQASSQPEIPPAADIFSLGCVLYECLTGKPPFEAPHFAAALAKILQAEPAPLHTLRPGLPQGLQVLVDRMLAKDPKRRLADAGKLLEALTALESVPELLLLNVVESSKPSSLAGAEQMLVSVLLISLQAMATGAQRENEARGLMLRDSLRAALPPKGGQVELLADGSLVATLVPEHGTATDQVLLAARCALSFKERWSEASVVLTTGLGVFNERLPVGEAMDRAGRLLSQLERMPSSSAVVMDEVTAGLLGPGFQLSRLDSGAFLLQGEQLGADASRPLLGKPTPCVGREQELALLDFTLNSCIEEPAARALLVTAPAGVGKSRLLHEFLRRVERREQQPLLLVGRGDPMRMGASYGLLGQALRRLCGVMEGESLEAQRARLFQRVVLHVPEAEAGDVVEFLGELCAIPFPEESRPRLHAARRDPQLMSMQVGRALVAFLAAECAHSPVLLVLEDLHWSDALTVQRVDGLLRELAEQPFMVLALAQPEVKELFPGLWARRLQELSLKGLSRKACTRLVHEVLGPQVPEAVVRKAVEQSDGNALFLEELIRMVAEGRGETAPETVLAVLQARLMRMEPGARQVLMAASIFGRFFWPEGVSELLGRQTADGLLEEHLRLLVEQEVIESLSDSRFPTMAEYRFRHALVRDAAYGLVTDSHRPMGHQLAGAWLERMGEPDALVLATHSRLGQQPERAIHFYTRAAERLFERNDLQGTMRCVESALSCGVSGEALTRLRALQSLVLFWMARLTMALELGIPALAGLKAGSPLWCRLMTGLILASIYEGHQEQGGRLAEWLLRTDPEPEAVEPYVEAVAIVGAAILWSGDRQKVESVLGRLITIGADIKTHASTVRGFMSLLKCQALYYFEARPWQAFSVSQQGREDFSAVGSERNTNMMQITLGMTLAAMGDLSGSVKMAREALATALRTEQPLVAESARFLLNLVLAGSPNQADRQEAHASMFEWLDRESSLPFVPGMKHAILAQVMAASGALREAELHAHKACELLALIPVYVVFARTVLSAILLAQERATESLRVASLGVQELERMGSEGVYAVSMRLALAEACFAEGDARAGEEALRKALRCVRARASDIPEAAARERFLYQVPENARTLELARQRWGEAAM
ncbi:serine/threonine-protein kinase PknK [Vitiosangium sp. GDMCC 1.1324]|uniref:serine/threonine-protein kinase n=1 Tax=Vitiosangium sp. (strain GDMCC 1.1324) TaxID=2138576 RepID=UPI000D3CAEA5|nr:serine/threonine-protein kinase [Vitiosangium sp. GDMCC 1.1324]PTL80692.1 serine/threonine-protein kinase PknK [Vitiosangium sp. GDMCC 1.1324]